MRTPETSLVWPRAPEHSTHESAIRTGIDALFGAGADGAADPRVVAAFAAVRDRAIFSLLFSGGLRRAELTGLKLNDIDLLEGVCMVTGKGGHQRLVPFGTTPAQRIDEYLRARDTWINQRGRQAKYSRLDNLWIGEMGPLTIWGVSQAIDRRLRHAGLRHLSAHAFRRGWAVKAVQSGINESLR